MAFEEKNVNEKQYYLLDKSYNKDGFTIAKSPSASAIYEAVKNLSDKYINDPNQEELKRDMKNKNYTSGGDYNPTENRDFGWYITKHKWEIEESNNGNRELRAAVQINTQINEEDYDEKTNDIKNIYVQGLSENYDEEFVEKVVKEKPEYKDKIKAGSRNTYIDHTSDKQESFSLDDLAKAGREAAMQKEQSKQTKQIGRKNQGQR